MLGPAFQRPAVSWLDGWRTSLPQQGDERNSPENLQGRGDNAVWWRSFNDPVLDALVTEAQQKNPVVRIAGLRILESRAQLGIAGSELPRPVGDDGGVGRAGRLDDFDCSAQNNERRGDPLPRFDKHFAMPNSTYAPVRTDTGNLRRGEGRIQLLGPRRWNRRDWGDELCPWNGLPTYHLGVAFQLYRSLFPSLSPTKELRGSRASSTMADNQKGSLWP